MICLSSSAIMIATNDGTKKAFDSEELQSKLINSCLVSGLKDFWLAEDLANAVENALAYQTDNGVTFSESEINLFLVKILEDAGYPNVASNFKSNNIILAEDVNISVENIYDILKNNLGLKGGDLIKLSKKVYRACDSLEIQNASLSLVIELGRYYRNKNINFSEFSKFGFTNISGSSWILSRKKILPLLDDNINDLLENNMIDISGVSSLFPSIKLSIRMEVLAEYFNLAPILTELVLFPCFDLAIHAVNEIISSIKNYILSRKEEYGIKQEIPVYLRFTDIHSFVRKYFGIVSPGGEAFCREIAVSFAENLKFPVQIKGI
ncbi:MAG TPA: hypothetical protein QF753_05640 [Victivallales bacterium]|nr:hypothetical protein [Victivallales bacterium]